MNKYMKQPCRSPINPIVANLFMEEFETKANPPILQQKYVDDTFFNQRTEHRNKFPEHITSTDPYIQFTTEEPETNTDVSKPF